MIVPDQVLLAVAITVVVLVIWEMMLRNPSLFRLLLAAALLILIGLALSSFASAQVLPPGFSPVPVPTYKLGNKLGDMGYAHGKYHDTYLHWHNRKGGSCCNDNDCRPTLARIRDDGVWEAMVDGDWTPVPPDNEIDVPAPDGLPHVCATDKREVLCFVKPPAT